jgi:hypothetical protein
VESNEDVPDHCLAGARRLRFGAVSTCFGLALGLGLAPSPSSASDPFPIAIQVDASKSRGELKPIHRFFGADEPNYAYMKDGRKLLAELGKLGTPQAFFRTHNLLTSGDGTPALKWGSTNVYTEDAQGRPVYDWTIVDRIFDAYLQRGLKPYAQIGVIGESDPEGCAACQGPQLGYRNGTMYASHTAASFARKHDLAEKHGVNLEGALTWAFEFEDQRYFAGFRALATNGIDLAVLNVFRMFGKMGGSRLAVRSSGEVPLEATSRTACAARPTSRHSRASTGRS